MGSRVSRIAVGAMDEVVLGTTEVLLEKQHRVEHFTHLLRFSLSGLAQSLASLPGLSEN